MLISVVIPMYNEEANVSETLQRVDTALGRLKQEYEIVVVDDGSSDRTLEYIRDFARKNKRVRILRHEVNRGLGEAVKTGFRGSKGEVVVTIDADLSYDPEDIQKLISRVGDYDLVLGSPYMQGGGVEGVPYLRLLLSRIGNRVIAYSISTKLSTVTSIFRAYRRNLINSMTLKSSGPELMPEIIAKASAIGFRIKEVPTVLKCRVRGKSKFNFVSGVKKHLILSLSVALTNLHRKSRPKIHEQPPN
jgi:glycosyltransferase involved in cell wall biosynthesis